MSTMALSTLLCLAVFGALLYSTSATSADLENLEAAVGELSKALLNPNLSLQRSLGSLFGKFLKNHVIDLITLVMTIIKD